MFLKVLCIPGGARFLPSTVCSHLQDERLKGAPQVHVAVPQQRGKYKKITSCNRTLWALKSISIGETGSGLKPLLYLCEWDFGLFDVVYCIVRVFLLSGGTCAAQDDLNTDNNWQAMEQNSSEMADEPGKTLYHGFSCYSRHSNYLSAGRFVSNCCAIAHQ